MTNAYEILVIILSVALAAFLVLAIILLMICIKIANHIKHITERAESFSDKAENIAEFLSKSTYSLIAGKFIATIIEVFTGAISKNKNNENKKTKRGFRKRGEEKS